MRTHDLIAVDVGVNGYGWARWQDVKRDRTLRAPDHCGSFGISSKYLKDPFHERAEMILFDFVTTGFSLGGFPKTQVLEWPEFRAGSAVGHAAASRDSLSMLAFMCGMHCRAASINDCRNVLVPVGAWKGQLSKELVTRRLVAAIGTKAKDGTEITSHAWDAVGLGLHALGHSVKTMSAKRSRNEEPRRFFRRRTP